MKVSNKFYKWLARLCMVGIIVQIFWLLFIPFYTLFVHGHTWLNKITISVFSFSSNHISMTPLVQLLSMIQVLLILFLLYNLLVFFRNLSKGNIFTYSNANSIIQCGVLISIMALFQEIVPIVLAKDIVPYLTYSQGEVALSFTIPFGYFIASIAIITLGIIYKKAVKIAEEQQLTI
ncbi:DUF2975 domain-containing protein [Halalkalibacter alkalisediminis]|uniref:DUF2975 domain-containing protein n=1 Tax=Halalkalibacter alkalisediminis TaxID=935616 RepID=A0ABV6NJ64_9BACI|nr:DUF2975 domain-containing protein [Halalkalibacter alkalisediminis]